MGEIVYRISSWFYFSPNNIHVMNELSGACVTWAVARAGDRRGEKRILVGRHGRKRPLTKPRHRCGDNIKMHLQEIRWGS
jgi:hypothetical protein